MMQNELITKRPVAAIGEEIGYELGAQLVKNYQVANPTDTAYCVLHYWQRNYRTNPGSTWR
jgi:hypothetical protein